MTTPTDHRSDEFDPAIYGPSNTGAVAHPRDLGISTPATPAPYAAALPEARRDNRDNRSIPSQARPIAEAAGLLGPTENVAPVARQSPIRANAMVAGAAATGHGVLVGLAGKGTMTHAEYTQLCDTAAIPADWRMSPKTAHAQAGRIVQNLNNAGFVARADRSKSTRGQQIGSATRVTPTWSARWQIARISRTGNVGAAFGEIVCTVTLTQTDELQIESSDSVLVERIRNEFAAAISASVYQATDVSAWLASTIVCRFRGARLGGNWYVRREFVASCERMLRTFAQGWGREWLLPPLPVATSDELCSGLVKNFLAEAEIVLDGYRAALDEAKKHGNDRISSRSARPLYAEIVTLTERAVEFSALFAGNNGLRVLRQRLSAVGDEIASSLDGTVQRFELIFDELARERGGKP